MPVGLFQSVQLSFEAVFWLLGAESESLFVRNVVDH
jgi:hypothetical protein